MSTESNPHLQRPDLLHTALTQYKELKWRLAFLRTGGAEPAQEPTNEEIIEWHIRNKEYGGLTGLNWLGELNRGMTPNLWFEQRFPTQTQQFGPAFLELKQTGNGYTKTTPISINIDFFASILSDPKLGLSIIYFEQDQQFYYIEPMLQLYKPTSPEKLQNLYRGLLVRCAVSLNDDVNILNLFHEFRSDKVARLVTQRAKSVLAADSSFFSPTSKHQRIRGIELHERIARRFVDALLTCEPGNVLLLADAYAVFCNMVKQQNLDPVKRADFKAMIVPMIKDQFDVCLRNDLQIDERQGVRGWKNVKLIQTAPG
jgi:hypothetical protein